MDSRFQIFLDLKSPKDGWVTQHQGVLIETKITLPFEVLQCCLPLCIYNSEKNWSILYWYHKVLVRWRWFYIKCKNYWISPKHGSKTTVVHSLTSNFDQKCTFEQFESEQKTNFDQGCWRVFPGVLLVLAIKEGSLRLFKLGNIWCLEKTVFFRIW